MPSLAVRVTVRAVQPSNACIFTLRLVRYGMVEGEWFQRSGQVTSVHVRLTYVVAAELALACREHSTHV